jgi:hypothetical protein
MKCAALSAAPGAAPQMQSIGRMHSALARLWPAGRQVNMHTWLYIIRVASIWRMFKQVHPVPSCGMPLQQNPWWSAIQVLPSSHVFECAPVRLAAAQRLRVSSVAASAVAIDPNSHRVVDTELRDEAEKSYLAVRPLLFLLLLQCPLRCR